MRWVRQVESCGYRRILYLTFAKHGQRLDVFFELLSVHFHPLDYLGVLGVAMKVGEVQDNHSRLRKGDEVTHYYYTECGQFADDDNCRQKEI